MKNYYFVLFIMIFGCTAMRWTTPKTCLTEEQKAYIDKVNACPLEITVSGSEIEDAWGRAQSFIGLYSPAKIQTVTDFVIQTYNPSISGRRRRQRGTYIKYGYYITKTPVCGNFLISVRCVWRRYSDNSRVKEGVLNAHILAFYIKTGFLPYPNLISR